MPLSPTRLCTECDKSLEGKLPTAKTCGHRCRNARARRIRREVRAGSDLNRLSDEQREIRARIEGEKEDAIHELVTEELRPVVRESITEDTFQAIAKLVALTPEAVAALHSDLASANDAIRQRAYTLILKYTMGNPAVVSKPEDADGKVLNVHFELPRPGDEPAEVVELEATEMKQCDKCGEDKPDTDFIANSTRCSSCYEEGRARAEEILNS